MDQEKKENNYSYTPPVHNQQQPLQQIVYTQKKGSNWWKYLLGCGFLFLIIACICSIPFLMIATLSSSFSGSNNDSESRIQEKQLTTIGDTNSAAKGKIAIVNVTGAISYSMPSAANEVGATSNNLISQIRKANDDPNVNLILLRFNSPGGEVSAAEPICNVIRNSKKPVYSFIDSMGASLGYLLPNCTKYIYARPSSVTGSIGVILQAVDFYGVLEKFGGKVVFVTNSEGKQKSGQEIFDKNSETFRTYQTILDETYDYFLTQVESGRIKNHPELTKAKLKEYADGRIFSGNQAKQINLIDELGEFDTVLNSIIKKESSLNGKNVEVVEYEITSNPFTDLLFGAKTATKSLDLKENLDKSSSYKLMMQSGLVDFSSPNQ